MLILEMYISVYFLTFLFLKCAAKKVTLQLISSVQKQDYSILICLKKTLAEKHSVCRGDRFLQLVHTFPSDINVLGKTKREALAWNERVPALVPARVWLPALESHT